jgi:hypothetical protein
MSSGWKSLKRSKIKNQTCCSIALFPPPPLPGQRADAAEQEAAALRDQLTSAHQSLQLATQVQKAPDMVRSLGPGPQPQRWTRLAPRTQLVLHVGQKEVLCTCLV